jgi:hypothetical protein
MALATMGSQGMMPPVAGIYTLAKYIADHAYAGKNAAIRDRAAKRYWQRLRRALEVGELTKQPNVTASVDLDELAERFDDIWPVQPRADWMTEGLDSGWHEWKRGGRFVLTDQAVNDPINYAKWIAKAAARQQHDERGLILRAILKYRDLIGYTKERNGS